jgi:hypothetical protein
MAATFDTMLTPKAPAAPKFVQNWRAEEEPWPIWAAVLVYLNILVISAKVWGPAGLVSVAVPAAFVMLGVLLMIVRGK